MSILTPDFIARELLQIKAIKLSPQKPFTWASGLKSPIYCDNRMVLSYPDLRSKIIDAFIEQSKIFVPFDVIGGVATAGIAHAALIADRMELPMIYIRSEAKSHGMGNQVEGNLEAGQRVLVIEDLLSTGGSSLKAVDAVRATGATVVGVLAIFSYGFDACITAFANANCPYKTLTDYPTLNKIAKTLNYITELDMVLLADWNQNPKAWSDHHQSQNN
jgi:orotate phosphoribosyltransferase